MPYAAARIFVQRNIVFFDKIRVLVLDVVGVVFGGVLAALGVIIAEVVHHVEAHAVAFGAHLVKLLFHRRVQVVAVLVPELEQPRHVIDAGDFPFRVVELGHVERFCKPRHAHLHAVAKPYGFHTRVALHIARQHSHGVGVVEEQHVGANLLHDVGVSFHHGNGA